MIATPAAVAELLPQLEKNERIAADTEADSLHCYREKLCLLQISVPDDDFLVDPLANLDLSTLTEVLGRKELVLHGADYDLRLLRRALNFQPTRIFDTSIAARLLGEREFSYAALVLKFCEVTLTKGSQKANWALRPLSSQMEKYARNDTHYLLPIAATLESELKARGRFDWFRQSCERAIQISAVDRERDSAEAWRIRGSGLVRGLEAAVLRALWTWRDHEAALADRPAFHVLRNEQLLEASHLAATGGAPNYRHFSGRRAREFRETWQGALQLPEAAWPIFERKRGERPTREMERAAEAMRARRDKVAGELGIDPSFIAPRATIDAIAAVRERAEAMLARWQRELLGI